MVGDRRGMGSTGAADLQFMMWCLKSKFVQRSNMHGLCQLILLHTRRTLLSLKHELRVMQPQGSGSIINISSTMGERGAANLALYTASKHAVEGLTKSAALEAAPLGVRVNAVAPRPTETAMLDRLTGTPDKKAAFYAAIPLKRGAKPEEIADTV